MGTMLRKAVEVETAFGHYTLTEQIGQGGAGRVFAAKMDDGTQYAVKVLSAGQVTSVTRRRFKNETAFLLNNEHRNIVKVMDYGVVNSGSIVGPFYVMERYDGNLREALQRNVDFESRLKLFVQILDGVEAAHLLGACHRDLKPDNVLFQADSNRLAVADFGVAQFTTDQLVTFVETSPEQRLANFEYAAPEQRSRGNKVTKSADIYALGLMLIEIMTGVVPHGLGYKTIGSVAGELRFLDPIAAKMLSHEPGARHASIAEIKNDIERFRTESVTQQRLAENKRTVIAREEITDPLAFAPPTIVGAEWKSGRIYVTLDQAPSGGWTKALQGLGNYRSMSAAYPANIDWHEQVASIAVAAESAQEQITIFKEWFKQATAEYKGFLDRSLSQLAARRREQLEKERTELELRLKVNQSLKF